MRCELCDKQRGITSYSINIANVYTIEVQTISLCRECLNDLLKYSEDKQGEIYLEKKRINDHEEAYWREGALYLENWNPFIERYIHHNNNNNQKCFYCGKYTINSIVVELLGHERIRWICDKCDEERKEKLRLLENHSFCGMVKELL